MQSILVQLKSALVDLAAWEEVHRSPFILNFDVLVIAHKKASFSQFKDMLQVTNWTDYLACGHVAIRFLSDWCSLNVTSDAILTQGISTVKHTRQVSWHILACISLGVLGITEDTIAQITSNQKVLQVLQTTSDLGCLRLRERLVLVISLKFRLFVGHHEFCNGSLLQQVEQTRL